MLAGFLVSGLLPLVERCFSIVTDVSLLELADGSHPLLQELVRRAPGTYTHSMTWRRWPSRPPRRSAPTRC